MKNLMNWRKSKQFTNWHTGHPTGSLLTLYYTSNQSKQMSNNSSSSSSSGGIGFSGLLTVLFIGLKLTGHITWPWIWVLSPLWISALLAITILLIAFIVLFFLERN